VARFCFLSEHYQYSLNPFLFFLKKFLKKSPAADISSLF